MRFEIYSYNPDNFFAGFEHNGRAHRWAVDIFVDAQIRNRELGFFSLAAARNYANAIRTGNLAGARPKAATHAGHTIPVAWLI